MDVPAPRPPSIADKLRLSRKQQFVGRRDELKLFAAALAQPDPDFVLLHLIGPGGIGKSTLLRQFARLAQAERITTVLLDAHVMAGTTGAFSEGVARMLGVSAEAAIDALIAQPRVVLLVDTYERLASLDTWLRETIIERLSLGSLVVFAGRTPLSEGWRAAGWGDLVRVIALRNLPPVDSLTFLSQRGVPAEQHAAVLEFTHGHPLGLTLLAEVAAQGGAAHTVLDAPDVIASLLNAFLQDVPSRQHQLTLQTCAHARVTTEETLREVLDIDDAHPYFEWLRSLSFVESHASGLVPHDLARDVIDRDFEWRDPDGFVQIHSKLRAIAFRKIRHPASSWRERLRAREEIAFSHRFNPAARAFFDLAQLGNFDVEVADANDHSQILEAARRLLSEDEVACANFWLKRQPSAWYVVRDAERRILAFGCTLLVNCWSEEELIADPRLAVVAQSCKRFDPIREGDRLQFCRFKVEALAGRPVFNGPFMTIFNHDANLRGHHRDPLLDGGLICSEERVLAVSVLAGAAQIYEHDTGRERWAFYIADRRDPDFLDVVIKRNDQVSRDRSGSLPPEWTATPVTTQMLSEPDFATASLQALKDCACPDVLARNPLLRSRLFAGEAVAGASALQHLLREAVESLRAHPRTEKFYKALWHTYIQPAPTQEAAAELLGLPFNTYRYQLERGQERVVGWLWRKELAASG